MKTKTSRQDKRGRTLRTAEERQELVTAFKEQLGDVGVLPAAGTSAVHLLPLGEQREVWAAQGT